jgi:hypothetical protein
LWPEDLRIGAEDVFASVHGIHTMVDYLAFLDEYRAFTVSTSADRENRIFGGLEAVGRNGRV